MTITKHAAVRMQQRRIGLKDIEIAIAFGREHFVRGYIIYVIGNREITKFRKVADLSQLNGLHVVITSGQVVTTYRSRSLSRRTLANKRPFRIRSRRRAS